MAITGKSPIEFIRAIRIKRGRSLLEQGRTNISEVAYTVGLLTQAVQQVLPRRVRLSAIRVHQEVIILYCVILQPGCTLIHLENAVTDYLRTFAFV